MCTGRGGLSAAPPEQYRDRLLGKLDDILEPLDIDPAAPSGPGRAAQPEAAEEAERGMRVTPGGMPSLMFQGSTFPGAGEGEAEGPVANAPTR